MGDTTNASTCCRKWSSLTTPANVTYSDLDVAAAVTFHAHGGQLTAPPPTTTWPSARAACTCYLVSASVKRILDSTNPWFVGTPGQRTGTSSSPRGCPSRTSSTSRGPSAIFVFWRLSVIQTPRGICPFGSWSGAPCHCGHSGHAGASPSVVGSSGRWLARPSEIADIACPAMVSFALRDCEEV